MIAGCNDTKITIKFFAGVRCNSDKILGYTEVCNQSINDFYPNVFCRLI